MMLMEMISSITITYLKLGAILVHVPPKNKVESVDYFHVKNDYLVSHTTLRQLDQRVDSLHTLSH